MEKDRLQFIFTEDSFRVDRPERALNEHEEQLKAAFLKDRFAALFHLGFAEETPGESPSLGFLRTLSECFIRSLTDMPELELTRENTHVEPDEDMLEELVYSVPFGLGTEYIGIAWIQLMYSRMNASFAAELKGYEGSVRMFLEEKSQRLRIPERVFFHVVENKDDDTFPFAFLATYATKDEEGRVRHMPLSFALTEYNGQREKLIQLLSCLNKAAEASPLIAHFVESGEMFHPLKLSASDAYELLKAAPKLEEGGILVRVPNWWKKKYAQPHMQVILGEKKPSLLGFDALVSMTPSMMVNGELLTEEEIRFLLSQTEGLAKLKGKWVEVDHARLAAMLEEMKKYHGDLTLLEAMRMETGFSEGEPEIDIGPKITNGKWLGKLLGDLRRPGTIRKQEAPGSIDAVLRPYQLTGFNWLTYMRKLGFGACLADDMGLGKTLQVLTFLDGLRLQNEHAQVLLIVPASLIGNWRKESLRFAPKIDFRILHGYPAEELDDWVRAQDVFLNITTYGMAVRMESLQEKTWDCLILDEAQAIKNPGTKQTRQIKSIKAASKIAMTGTPIENDLTNLWSLFDFLNKGLLGTSSEFKEFSTRLETHQEGYQKLKSMVSPFILRRLKTDKTIIRDLPEKLELPEYVELTKKQIALYEKLTDELARSIETKKGMERRGLVLSSIMKLKQICNHPDQYLGQEAYDPAESGKFGMLRELCETIAEKRERVLVFTQYKEITFFLAQFLEEIFGAKGLVLHGGTRIGRRAEMVEEFNGEDYVPFMVLSLKAGGTGLNLTAANHVIHFDRWWNPAVENQATDRAFRIGQTKNVFVHKLISRGTLEERIDKLIESKKELAENVVGKGGEAWITELGNDELMNLMRLEI